MRRPANFAPRAALWQRFLDDVILGGLQSQSSHMITMMGLLVFFKILRQKHDTFLSRSWQILEALDLTPEGETFLDPLSPDSGRGDFLSNVEKLFPTIVSDSQLVSYRDVDEETLSAELGKVEQRWSWL